MALIQPAGWRELAVTGAALREIDTLTVLEKALSDDYRILHGVHWTQAEQGYSVYGEIDFIVIAPTGKVLLIEQRSGFLTETPDGLVKRYEGREQNVRHQITRAVSALQRNFGGFGAQGGPSGEALEIDYLLYCPDYLVRKPQAAGIDASRIVDASRRDRLAAAIAELLPAGPVSPHLGQVLRFFSDTLGLKPDASTLIGQAAQLVTRLSGGLAQWARSLEFEPFRLRVIGTAGSGKTQLAIAEFTAALEQGRHPLYVCFNRPLADHVRRLVPSGGRVATFHSLCDEFMRNTGFIPDYSKPGVWEDIARRFHRADIPAEWMHDVLIVDEGQDFSEEWRDAVMRLLLPHGRAFWLEDPMQNLYGRAPVDLPGWVTLRSQANYRSPRQIVELLASLGGEAGQVQAASPFLGADIDCLTCPDDDVDAMLEETKRAITACLGAGFTRSDIVLLSFRGREHSALLRLDALGVHALRSFSGSYDLFGNPVFRKGELLAESLYRFKGQSAPAVILTEVDFDALDDKARRKLFVGMTRARLKLVLVMSERAARLVLPGHRSAEALPIRGKREA